MTSLWHDVRYSLRLILTRPAMAMVAILSLAIGIGANTAIFSVVNGVLLEPLPFPESDRIVMLWETGKEGAMNNTSFATVADWREQSTTFSEIAAFRSWLPTLTGDGTPERINGLRVSPNFFRILGVAPALGRDLRPEEDTPSTRRVVVISDALWRDRFGADPDVIGKPVQLSGSSFEIVGVMPADFDPVVSTAYYERAEMWAPLGYDETLPEACRTCRHILAIGRLADGATLDQARAELESITLGLAREYSDAYGNPGTILVPLQEHLVGDVRTALLVLLAAVGLVLLISCANVANLLLAHATRREREIVIRASLGASRWRIARQMLIESLLLSTMGAALGLLLAVWGTSLLVWLGPDQIPRLAETGVDARVLLFTLVVAVATGVGFGAVPALHASRVDLHGVVTQGQRATEPRGRRRTRGLLVVTEVAVALVLLVGAGLLVRSFMELVAIDPGFETENLLTMGVNATGPQFEDEGDVVRFYAEVQRRVAEIPSVASVGLVSNLPMGGNRDGISVIVEGQPLESSADAPRAERYGMTAGYRETMGIPLLRGRDITDTDGPDAPFVVLVGETMAERLWPGEEAIGKRIRLGGDPDAPWRTVVGIVGDVRHKALDVPAEMQVYLPQPQWGATYLNLVVKTRADSAAMADAIRREIWSVDKDQPVYDVATMEQLIADTMVERRFSSSLVTLFAVVALLLAGLGIYGVVAYAVATRTFEMGIRRALGAQSWDIYRLVLSHGIGFVVVGIAVGLVASIAATRLLAGLLFGVGPFDALTYVAVSTLLLAAAFAATILPARRAARVDPAKIMRSE